MYYVGPIYTIHSTLIYSKENKINFHLIMLCQVLLRSP